LAHSRRLLVRWFDLVPYCTATHTSPHRIDGLPVISFAAYLHWNDVRHLEADGLWTVVNVEPDVAVSLRFPSLLPGHSQQPVLLIGVLPA